MRAILSGYYGFGNSGDEALLTSLLQMLPPQVEPIVLSQTPDLTTQTYNVQACPRRDGLVLFKELQSAQAFIWGGGSLLQDVTSWRSPLYYLSLMAVAQQWGLTSIAWAQGIGPLRYGWNRWLTQRCLHNCTVVSVRDPTVSALLHSWRIPHQLGVDPVWALDPGDLADWSRPDPVCMAVVLRQHPELTMTRLAILIQALKEFQQQRQVFILLVPFQVDPYTQTGPDLRVMQAIHHALPDTSQIVVFPDPRRLRALFTQVEFAITMRYHSLVMAAAAGCRCFSLSYDPKVRSLAQQLSMPVWDLTEMPTDPIKIAQAWITCWDAGVRLDPLEIDHWRQQARIHGDLLAGALVKDPSC